MEPQPDRWNSVDEPNEDSRDVVPEYSYNRSHRLCQFLKIGVHQRQQTQISQIVRDLLPYEFFQKHRSRLNECARHFQLMEFASGTAIAEYNSDPEEFFLLVEGQAIVLLRKTPAELEADKELMKRLGSQHWRSLQPSEHKLLKNSHFQGEVCKFKKIAQLKEGATFGELGIIYNKPRIALIVASKDCSLAVLKKEHYLRIFCETEDNERKVKRQFIFSHFLERFRELKYETCESILYSFQERRLSINDILCHEGEPFRGLMLVKSGEVVISKNSAKKRLVSIVTRGKMLCEGQWIRTLSSGKLAQLSYTAKVLSSEARVYYLNWEEMQKIFNFKSLMKELVESPSYLQYLNRREAEEDEESVFAEQEREKQNMDELRMKGMRQEIEVEKRLLRELKQQMMASVLSCEAKPVKGKEVPKRAPSRLGSKA